MSRWYFGDRQRLCVEVEAVVIETNVADYVMGKAKVNDKSVSFEELMGASRADLAGFWAPERERQNKQGLVLSGMSPNCFWHSNRLIWRKNRATLKHKPWAWSPW